VIRLLISALCLHVLFGLDFDPYAASVAEKALAGALWAIPALCLASVFYGRNQGGRT